MRTRLALMFLPLLVLAFAGRADAQFRRQEPVPPPEDFHVQLSTMWWTPKPTLTIDTDQVNNLTGGSVDFVQEFNIANVRFRDFSVVLKPAQKHKFRVSHVPVEYQQSATLQQTITYKGVTFPVTLPATADLKWDLWRFGYEYDFVSSQHGLAGLLTELKYNNVTGNITSSIGSASTEQKAPIPTIGLIVRGYVHRYISLSGEFSGFKVPHVKSFDGKFWDVDLYATGSITKYVGVQAGYRSVIADYTVDNDKGDLKLKGPYIGGMIRF